MESKPLPGMEDNFEITVVDVRQNVKRLWGNADDHDFVIGIDFNSLGN